MDVKNDFDGTAGLKLETDENDSSGDSSEGFFEEGLPNQPKTKLTVYLLKNGEENCVREDEDKTTRIKAKTGEDIYIGHPHKTNPPWVRRFFREELLDDLTYSSSPRVVVVKTVCTEDGPRRFALVFGAAKWLINQDAIEERFGLKVALNVIETKGIRKISKSCIGTNQKRTDEQMPRGADISEFGFDIARDLIKGVSGKASIVPFKKCMITGSDYLSSQIACDLSTVGSFLSTIYTIYKAKRYHDQFPWLDNIKAVKERRLIERLDAELLCRIMAKDFDSVWMSIPEVLPWEDIDSIQIQGDKTSYDDVQIEKVCASFRNEPTSMADFKGKTIRAMRRDDSREIYNHWTAYNCLVGDIDYQGDQYCISDGKWYAISKDYADDINRQYSEIELLDLPFPAYRDGEGEDSYNKRLAEGRDTFVEMHKTKLPLGGGSGNNIEPCDLYEENMFIHVKRNGGSSVLSHLFMQGLVSAGALLENKTYTKFVQKAKSQIKEQGSKCQIPSKLQRNDTTVVFAIINKYAAERPRIPFFSKTSVCSVASELMKYGYKLKLKNIPYADEPEGESL